MDLQLPMQSVLSIYHH